jgi:hypothetical protein
MDSIIKRYIKTETITEDTFPKYILIESLEFVAIVAALNKTMAELEKKKSISADILMDFKAMQKRIEKIIKKPIMANEKKILQSMLEELLKS